MSTQLKVWVSILLGALILYTTYVGVKVAIAMQAKEPAETATSGAIENTHFVGNISDEVLTDSAGKPFSLSELKGDVWIASFFFTACPGPCAQMNRAIAGLQQEFPEKDLKFISITCDPTNDTPEVLADYAHNFGADPKRWKFLTCPLEEAQHIGTQIFKVAVAAKMHTERVILIDRASKVRGMYVTSDPSQMIALKRKLRELLGEDTSQAEAAPQATDKTEPPASEDAAPAESAAQEGAAADETSAASAAAESSQGDAASAAKEPAGEPQ